MGAGEVLCVNVERRDTVAATAEEWKERVWRRGDARANLEREAPEARTRNVDAYSHSPHSPPNRRQRVRGTYWYDNLTRRRLNCCDSVIRHLMVVRHETQRGSRRRSESPKPTSIMRKSSGFTNEPTAVSVWGIGTSAKAIRAAM